MADKLTPSQFLEPDKSLLKGLILRSGGTVSIPHNRAIYI